MPDPLLGWESLVKLISSVILVHEKGLHAIELNPMASVNMYEEYLLSCILQHLLKLFER